MRFCVRHLALLSVWMVLCASTFPQDGRDTGVPAGAGAPAVRAIGKQHAILIGINKFKHLPASLNLQYAEADVKAVQEVLTRYYGFEPEHITVLLNEQATREAIIRQFDLLVDKERFGENDQVLIYIATHGKTIKVGQKESGYIVPYDAKFSLDDAKNASEIATTCVLMDDLLNRIDIAVARSVLILADSCMSGMLIRSIEPSAALRPGIEVLMRKPARQIIAAGQKDQKAFEDPKWGGGAFTSKVVEHLKAWAEAKPGVPLSASELWTAVLDGVTALTEGRQTPHCGNRPGYDGQFVFVPVGSRAPRRLAVSNAAALRQTIAQAYDGDVILLEPGDYRLTEPIEITVSIHIQGAGADKTRIVLESGDAALRFSGLGRFSLQGVAFEYTGAENPELALVEINSGEAQIAQCNFKGAKGKTG
ncbi:MAG: caspase family protein, partial [Fimbriimonadales bacterium]|nr:caspase family protein [Fimbriimonadales bacterium]